ncbi:MAG: esterase-like activity of phytase family protein [Xenococcaceae cyanobacterium MO_167.B27]|nr:esterase-like activity of phytase family protein [Xenococcaceae cyanobacterium MO_167.B27]
MSTINTNPSLVKLLHHNRAKHLLARNLNPLPLVNIRSIVIFIICVTCWWILTACSTPPQVLAEERMFLNLSLEFLDSYQLPKNTFQNTTIGGLSAITYDRTQDRYYVLSDDRSNRGDARFYTLKLDIQQQDTDKIKITNTTIENVTFLLDETGNRYAPGTIDPEGIALSPRGTVFISSEGNPSKNIAPFIGEFDLQTGQKKINFRLPQRYLTNPETEQGIRENLGFESLTLNQNGLAADDPFRLFTATESALVQDTTSEPETRIRFLHYVINPFGSPILVAEHLYLLDPSGKETISNGLTELLALSKEGYFLSLERTFGFTGSGAKIYQVVVGNATDTSTIANLEDISNIQTLRKKLVLNLTNLGIYLDNLEGMTIGSRLPDGSRSLILVSDDNFNNEQVTQLLLFRIRENSVS